jgi:hypothetical protein
VTLTSLRRERHQPAGLLVAWILGLGCSSGDPPAVAPPRGSSAHEPCDLANRVGGFALSLVGPMPPIPAVAHFTGKVADRVDSRDLWQSQAREGDCRLVTRSNPFCDPACSGDRFCGSENQCVPEPTLQDVGTVTLSGLSEPVTVKGINGMYYAPLPMMPFAVGADLRMMAAGGRHGSFSLAGRGIEPLVFESVALHVLRDVPLPLGWTPPAAEPASTRILASLDIAHHGGIAARLECDFADTGSGTIPARLITKLIERGIAGFPTINLTRRTVDSTALAAGCVELVVASWVERGVQVENVVSCVEDRQCPAGQSCGRDLKCR